MRNVALTCAAAALLASVFAAVLWRDLHTERQTSAALQLTLSEYETSPRAPALPAATSRPATATATGPASVPAATVLADRVEPAAAMNAAMPRNLVSRTQVTERDLLKDPEYRKARLGQLRMNLLQAHPDLAQELGLQPGEVDKLIGLLANNQMEMNSATAGVIQPLDQAGMQAQEQEMQRTQRLLQDDLDTELKALLGPTAYAKWQDYQQSRPARQLVTQFGRPLDTAGLPLTSEQIRPLATVMAAEQARQRRDNQAQASELASNQARRDPQTQLRLQEERLKQQMESNRRLLDAVAPHLSARQLEVLRTNYEQQSTLQRVSLRLRREAEQRNQQAP